MSKKQKNVAPNDAAPTQEQPVKKNAGYRILAFILLVVSAVALAVLPYNVFYASGEVKEVSLLTALLDAFSAEAKVFGAVPALFEGSAVATLSTIGMYLFALGLVVAALVSLFAIFSAKKAPRRVKTALFFLALGAVAYTFFFFVASKAATANELVADVAAFDLLSVAIAAVAVVFTFFVSLAKNGKAAWLRLAQFVLSAACAVLAVLPLAATALLVKESGATLAVVVIVLMALNTVIACARMSKVKDTVCDLVRYIVALLVALAACYVANQEDTAKITLAIVAAAIALFQIVLVIVQIKKGHKKEIEAAKEETAEEVTKGFRVEEYVEAYAYEGGPVAGVLMAEEVNPSFLPHEPKVQTAGYDFYNCKSFDPFVAMLNTEERNAFTELFILKFKGEMPEIPNYEVGGDNKEFFHKVFIYLGQYRDRIPSDLLGKMYQFAIKL